jgi:hypothetical protein
MNMQILDIAPSKQKVWVDRRGRCHKHEFRIGLFPTFRPIRSHILQGNRRILLIDRVQSSFVTDLLHGNEGDPLSYKPSSSSSSKRIRE